MSEILRLLQRLEIFLLIPAPLGKPEQEILAHDAHRKNLLDEVSGMIDSAMQVLGNE